MKPTILLGVLAALLIPFVSYGSATPLVTNTSEGWALQPPSAWNKEVSANGSFKMTTFYSQERNSSFRVMTTTYKYGSTDKENLKAYIEDKKETLARDLNSYAEIRSGKTKLGGAPAYELEFMWRTGPRKDRSRVIMASAGGRIYEIALTSTDAAWTSDLPVMESALSTFAFSKKLSGKATLSVSLKVEEGRYGATENDVGVALHDSDTGEMLSRVIAKKGKVAFKNLEQGKTYILTADSIGHQETATVVKMNKAKVSKKLVVRAPKEDGTDYHVILGIPNSYGQNAPVFTVGGTAQITFMIAAPAGTAKAYLARETNGSSVLLGSFPHVPGPYENVEKTYTIRIPNLSEGGDYFLYPEYLSKDGALRLGGERHPDGAGITYIRVVK